MALSVLQSKIATSASSYVNTISATTNSSVTAGSTLVAFMGSSGASDSATISDDKGNTWQTLQTGTNTRSAYLWYAKNVVAGTTTVTVNSGSFNERNLHVFEFGGASTIAPIDTSGKSVESGYTDSHPITLTNTTQPGIMISFMVGTDNGGSKSYTASGTTTATQLNDYSGTVSAYKSISSVGNQTITISAGGTSFEEAIVMGAVVLDSSATGTQNYVNQVETFQEVLTQDYSNSSTGSTYTEMTVASSPYYYSHRFSWDPSKFDSVSAIYFESLISITSGSGTVYVTLWNVTDNVQISGSEISTTTSNVTALRSSDIKANMPSSAKEIAIYIKASSTSINWDLLTGRIVVQQSTSATKIFQAFQITQGTVVTGTTTPYVTLDAGLWLYEASKFDNVDSIVFETNLYARTAGNTATVDVWDWTANSAVSGSSVSTTSNNTYTHVSTGDLKASLVDGHTYGTRIATSNTGAGSSGGTRIRIAQTNPTKTQIISTGTIAGLIPGTNNDGMFIDPSAFASNLSKKMYAEHVYVNNDSSSNGTLYMTDGYTTTHPNTTLVTTVGNTTLTRWRNTTQMDWPTVQTWYRPYADITTGTGTVGTLTRVVMDIQAPVTYTKNHSTDVYINGGNTLSTDYLNFSFGSPSYTRTHTTDVLRRKQNSISHTTDTLKRKAVTKTHTTDILKRLVATKSHTTSVNKLKSGITRTHTTDTLKRSNVLKTHSTDIFKRIQVTKTHSTDTFKRLSVTKTHTTDLVKRKTTTRTHTTDVNKRLSGIIRSHTTSVNKRLSGILKTHTTDALKRGVIAKYHTTDTLKRGLYSRSHTTDIFIRASFTRTHTTDVLKRKVTTKSHSTDVFTRTSFSRSHTTDVLKRAVVAKTHTTDILKRKSNIVAHSTDANKRKVTLRTHTTDVLKRAVASRTHTTDILKRKQYTKSHSTDTLLRKSIAKSHSTDTLLRGAYARIHNTDVNKRKVTTVSHSTSVNKLKTGIVKIHSTDINKRKSGLTRSHSTDTFLRKSVALVHTTDTLLRAIVSKYHSTDVQKRSANSVNHSTDILLRKSVNKVHTTDVFTHRLITKTHTTDIFTRRVVLKTHSTDILKRQSVSKTHTTSVNKRKVTLKTHLTDINKRKVTTKTHSTSINKLKSGVTRTHSTDLLKRARFTRLHSTDTFLRAAQYISHTADIFKRGSGDLFHVTDTFLRSQDTVAHTTDVLKFARKSLAHTTNTLKRASSTRIHTTDTLRRKNRIISHTTDVLKRKTVTKYHLTDINKRATGTKTHSTSVVKRKVSIVYHNTDTLLKNRLALAHSTDVLLASKKSLVHLTDVLKRGSTSINHRTDVNKTKRGVIYHTTDIRTRSASYLSHTTDIQKFDERGKKIVLVDGQWVAKPVNVLILGVWQEKSVWYYDGTEWIRTSYL